MLYHEVNFIPYEMQTCEELPAAVERFVNARGPVLVDFKAADIQSTYAHARVTFDESTHKKVHMQHVINAQ